MQSQDDHASELSNAPEITVKNEGPNLDMPANLERSKDPCAQMLAASTPKRIAQVFPGRAPVGPLATFPPPRLKP